MSMAALPPTPITDPTEGPCPYCSARKPGHCEECGPKLEAYENMGGAGYQSPAPTHRHIGRKIEGGGVREMIWAELCLGCYRLAWAKVYPEQAFPV